MLNEYFKSILHDDCDRLYKKFTKLSDDLESKSKLTNEYIESLPEKEREFVVEKLVTAHLQFIPMIELMKATSDYLKHIDDILTEMNKENKKLIDK